MFTQAWEWLCDHKSLEAALYQHLETVLRLGNSYKFSSSLAWDGYELI